MRKSIILFTLAAFVLGLFCGVYIITNYNNKLILATQNLVRTLSFQSAEKLAKDQLEKEKLFEAEKVISEKNSANYATKENSNILKNNSADDSVQIELRKYKLDSIALQAAMAEDSLEQSIFYETQNEDEFVVRKEELTASKSIRVNYIQQKNSDPDSSQQYLKNRLSLLESNDANKEIYTEFWQSPLNYKGYKFNRKKLVLYGFTSFDLISIYFFNENYYLKINAIPYILKPTEEYVSFAVVRDVELLKFLVNEN